MTREEIIELAKQVGMMSEVLQLGRNLELLTDFAKLVAEHVYAEYLELPEPKQSDTISITTPIGYLCENAVGHKYFRWKKPTSTYKPIALYTTPPQRKPLTDEQINAFFEGMEPNNGFWKSFAKAIEAAHNINE
jgi:hypothetical protein